MFNDLLKREEWSTETLAEFFNRLNDFFNEDKCIHSANIANMLIEKGGYKNYRTAEAILINAIRNYFDVEDTNYKAKIYFTLGYLYESQEEYIKSFTYYEKYTLNNTISEGDNKILLKIILLRDNFVYSEEMEKFLLRSYGEYDLGLRNDRIYEYIAEYLILLNENKKEKAEEKKKDLKALLKYGELPLLDLVIRKDAISNSLNVPQKVYRFIENL